MRVLIQFLLCVLLEHGVLLFLLFRIAHRFFGEAFQRLGVLNEPGGSSWVRAARRTYRFVLGDDRLELLVSLLHVGEGVLRVDQIFAHLIAFALHVTQFLLQLLRAFAHAIEEAVVLLHAFARVTARLSGTQVER